MRRYVRTHHNRNKSTRFYIEESSGRRGTLVGLEGEKGAAILAPAGMDQMRSLEVNVDKFEQFNTVPLGMSIDPVACKKAWAAVLLVKKIDLLCDFWPHGQVAADYGVFTEQRGLSKRVNIIIDEEGIVKWVKVYPISQLPDIEEVLQVLAAM